MKKRGTPVQSEQAKTILKTLTITQLKELAKIHKVIVRGKKEEDWFRTTTKAPTKAQYISAIAKKVSLEDIKSSIKDISVPVKKKKRRSAY